MELLEDWRDGKPPFSEPALWGLQFIELSRRSRIRHCGGRRKPLSLHDFVHEMPKAELHVHLEGSIRPSTLLTLAERNGVTLPAQDLEGLRAFYRFTDFDHFLQVYFDHFGLPEDGCDFEPYRLRVWRRHGPPEYPLCRGDLYAAYQRGQHWSAL